MAFFVKLSLLLPEYQNTQMLASCLTEHVKIKKVSTCDWFFSWLVLGGFVSFKGIYFCLFICFLLQDIMQCYLCWKNQISRKAFLVQSFVLLSASIRQYQCPPLLQLHLCWKFLSFKGAASFRSSTKLWNWPEVLLWLWPKEVDADLRINTCKMRG